MKRNGILLALGLLNAALLATVLWQARSLHSLRTAQELEISSVVAGPPSASSSGQPPEPIAVEDRPPPPKPPPLTAVPARPAFDWRRVESSDYRTYIENLRAIGCPAATVRDIVTADVVQNYAAKLAAVAAAANRDFKYWDTGPAAAERSAELVRQRHALDEEMGGVLRQLLGPAAVAPDTSREWQAALTEQQLAFLPADKRAQALASLRRYSDLDVQMPASTGDHLTADQTEVLQQQLQGFDSKRAELTALLTPEEYEQLDMTVSWTADNLRHAMARFQPTEAEFRAIFREWRAHDDRIARLWATGQPDPGNASVFEAIRGILGEQRYQEYRATWWH